MYMIDDMMTMRPKMNATTAEKSVAGVSGKDWTDRIETTKKG
jgi:hypothetical protein